MNQSGSGIHNDNLQEFLDSAANANEKGQQQFYTPQALATALCRPLPALRSELILDLSFGSGNLARGAGAKRAIGLDIDSRVTSELKPPLNAEWHVTNADLTQWYPLAEEVGFDAPFILLNPPFSLQWHTERIARLCNSSIPEVARTAKTFGKHADSTLASFLIALDLLRYNGEGFMVCNAATARRFFGGPATDYAEAPHPDLRKFIWLWLEIPGAIYENQNTKFDTAVLYFSRSHAQRGEDMLFLTSPSADPATVEKTLMVPEVFSAHQGNRVYNAYECRADNTLATFNDIQNEYRTRFKGKRPEWNIRLDEKGHIRTYLTPFQKTSRKLCRQLIGRLHSLNGCAPISLCVTATSRTALREAIQCGVWKVEPAVLQAVSQALAEYDREGAPFYRPNEVQSLGWIDEHGALECKLPGIGSCTVGNTYVIASSIEETKWKGTRTNLNGESENLDYTGRELLVTLTDPSDVKHHFHVRKDDKIHEDEYDRDNKLTAQHWHISDLVRHFIIPIPDDIATLRPQEYQHNLDRLAILQEIIRKNLAA